jgi:hypothetical protein
LVGAGAIALSPIAPLPADVVVKAGHAGTVYADYTPTALATAIVDTNAVSVPTPSDLATALGLLVLGGSQALNTGINGVGTGINQGLTALQNITSTTNTTLQGINNQLTAGFLGALEALHPTTPAPTAELKAAPLRALSAKALPAAADTSVGGGESVTVSVSTAPKAIEAATSDIKAEVKAKMGATSKVRVVEAPKADTSKADDTKSGDNGKSDDSGKSDSTKSDSTKSDSGKTSSTKADNPVKKLRDQVKNAMSAGKKDSAKTSGGDSSGGGGAKAGASSGGGGGDN